MIEWDVLRVGQRGADSGRGEGILQVLWLPMWSNPPPPPASRPLILLHVSPLALMALPLSPWVSARVTSQALPCLGSFPHAAIPMVMKHADTYICTSSVERKVNRLNTYYLMCEYFLDVCNWFFHNCPSL